MNTTGRHREWVNLGLGPATIRAFLVYPQRSDNAPVVMVTGTDQVDAAVVFYGTQPDANIMAKIKAPRLGFYGEDDARVTSIVESTVAAMKQLGKSFEPHIYPHATHGFLEFQDLTGNPAATSDSWARTIAFLNQHLK